MLSKEKKWNHMKYAIKTTKGRKGADDKKQE